MNGPAAEAKCADKRRRFLLTGQVQGVGFRPHVYRTARAYAITGFVRNTASGVEIEAAGPDLAAFLEALERDAPPRARIDCLKDCGSVASDEAAQTFEILDTADAAPTATEAVIPADLGLCPDCLAELFDPEDRHYRYPFIACSHCGPRHAIWERLPYDRAATTMADFSLCTPCTHDYTDPGSRRFHAEPLACPECGPTLSESFDTMARTLQAGGIVALKGIGGFHLLCDARNVEAVETLRRRKRRDGKPFALMTTNVASARRYVDLDDRVAGLLLDQRRPIVVAEKRPNGMTLPDALAPGLNTLGFMLPGNALHYVLLHTLLGEPRGTTWLDAENDLVLVATSANVSGEPLIVDGDDARNRLGDIADLIVDHDRRIPQGVDDSVLRSTAAGPVLIRRARGYAPEPVDLGDAGACVAATGAHLKNTVTVTRERKAFVSQHLGDLDAPAGVVGQQRIFALLEQLAARNLDAVACDWHNDYASTRFAEAITADRDLPLIRVQHHHAHIAAVLAEHRVNEPVLGLALDGHGLGADGEAWGGELLMVDGHRFERLGHLRTLAAPGGDVAAREPWRLAAAWLHESASATDRFAAIPQAAALNRLLDSAPQPRTSSAGRLFDCAAALLGVCTHAAFEGDAAMRLEGLVRVPQAMRNGFLIEVNASEANALEANAFEANAFEANAFEANAFEANVLDFTPLLSHLADLEDPRAGAEIFHGTLLAGLAEWVVTAASSQGIDTVALAGGCLLNRWLHESLPQRLEDRGLRVVTAQAMPPNDGAISLGQAWVARRALAAGATENYQGGT